MSVQNVVEQAFEAILFGSTWYFGILIFFVLAVGLLKTWKFSGALIFPMIVALEVSYFNRVGDNEEFIWPMICLGALALATAWYTVSKATKD